MAGKNLQHKYQNNEVVTAGYIRAELKQEDGLLAGNQFYVATVPEGVIVKGMVALLDAEHSTSTAEITVDIGMNDCPFCTVADTLTANIPNCDLQPAGCECRVTDREYLVRVTIDSNDVTDGDIMLLIEVINPEHVICSVEPIKLCTETVIIDPCTAAEDSACGCDNGSITNLTTTVTVGP